MMIYAAVFGLGMFIGGLMDPDEPNAAVLIGFLIMAVTGILYIGKTYL